MRRWSVGNGRPLTRLNYISYGAPAAPLAMAGLPLAVYLPVIYADSDGFGLSLATVGLLIALSRISDVVTDPLIGYLSDKWKTRWGRRKPWVLAGTPIFALGLWFLFIPPFEFSDVTVFGATFSNGYIWLVVMLTVFFIGSTIKDLPFSAYWGFDSLAAPRETTNTEYSLLMLACTYSVIPALFKFVGMPFLWIYPLTEEKLHDVQAEINKQHGIAGA